MTMVWAARFAEGDEASKTGSIGPGLSAFIVVLLLAVVTVFLMRSMLKHVGRVPASFDEPPPTAGDSDETAGADSSADGQPDVR